MNTVQMQCFLTVAKYLNFSKASEELKISQPAVSHQIRALEAELGVKLFHRTSKIVSLTVEGKLFLPDADKMLKLAVTSTAKLKSHDIPQILDIGCHNQFELRLFPPVFKTLKKEFPEFRPAIHLMTFGDLSRLLENGRLHTILGPENTFTNKSFHYKELYRCKVTCICSPNHPLARHTSLTSDILCGGMILYDPHKVPDSIFQIQNRAAAGLSANERYYDGALASILTLIRSELGYTIYPDIPPFHEEDLCYIPVTDYSPVSFGIYYKDTRNNPLLKRFLKLL